MDFGFAITDLRDGKDVRRGSWPPFQALRAFRDATGYIRIVWVDSGVGGGLYVPTYEDIFASDWQGAA